MAGVVLLPPKNSSMISFERSKSAEMPSVRQHNPDLLSEATEELDATEAVSRVGYACPRQFGREYR